jgi:hypothetical protein
MCLDHWLERLPASAVLSLSSFFATCFRYASNCLALPIIRYMLSVNYTIVCLAVVAMSVISSADLPRDRSEQPHVVA